MKENIQNIIYEGETLNFKGICLTQKYPRKKISSEEFSDIAVHGDRPVLTLLKCYANKRQTL